MTNTKRETGSAMRTASKHKIGCILIWNEELK